MMRSPLTASARGVSSLLSAGARRAQYAQRVRLISTFKAEYDALVEERAGQGIVPNPLNAAQVEQLVSLMEAPPADEEAFLGQLLRERVPPGVDEAAYVKAAWLAAIAKGETSSPLVSCRSPKRRERERETRGTSRGGGGRARGSLCLCLSRRRLVPVPRPCASLHTCTALPCRR